MRQPEHDFIQIAVSGTMADKIESVFPHAELVLYPSNLQDQGEDAIPIYFLGVPEGAFSRIKS